MGEHGDTSISTQIESNYQDIARIILQALLKSFGDVLVEESRASTDSGTYSVDNVKVPPGFLRTEYMIGYSFMGVMYGLGFLVLFQSILIPFAKILTFLLYVWLLYLGHIEPVTLQEAMQKLPPD